MTTTTKTTNDYRPGEALTGRMTAREWLRRFQPGMFEIMSDMGGADQGIAEITKRGHKTALRLNLSLSPTGHYPPVVWELESA